MNKNYIPGRHFLQLPGPEHIYLILSELDLLPLPPVWALFIKGDCKIISLIWLYSKFVQIDITILSGL